MRNLKFILVLFSLVGCLNSAVKQSDGASGNTRGSESVFGISPWTVKLQWKEVPGAKVYNVYEESLGSEVVDETKFTSTRVTVVPLQEYVFRIYPEMTSGVEDRRPFEAQVKAWPEFTSVVLKAKSQEQQGLAIEYSYSPWTSLQGDPQALNFMYTECAFVRNGNTSQDPFSVDSAVLIKAKTTAQVVSDTQCALNPSSNYVAACRVKYQDGTVSTSSSRITALSPSLCTASEDLPTIAADSIQVAPFPGFTINDAVDGILSLTLKGITKSGADVTENSLWTYNENIPSTASPILSIDLLNDVLHAGLARLEGFFTNNETSKTDSLVPKDLYIKSLNSGESVIFPPIINLEAAQEMGSAFAAGDFDCDGGEDLAIGMPATTWAESGASSSNPQKFKTGVVMVFYGKPNLGLFYNFTPDFIQPPPASSGEPRKPIILIPKKPEEGALAMDSLAGSRFGAALAVGNFNRDASPQTGQPCMDLVIGAPGESFTALDNTSYRSAGGSVYIAYGGSSGLRSAWTTAPTEGQYAGSCTPGSYPTTGNGLPSTAGGNVIPIQANASGCGGLHLVPLEPATGLDKTTALSSYYQSLNHNVVIGRAGFSESSNFGAALAAGDFDFDGYDDLIVGAPNASHYIYQTPGSSSTGAQETGAAFVYFGGTFGIKTNVDLSAHTGNSSILADGNISPIKLMPAPVAFSTVRGFGASVGIGRLEDRSDNGANPDGASVFVGTPGFSSNRGAVGVAHWQMHFANVASAYKTRKLPVLQFALGTSHNFTLTTVGAETFVGGTWAINPTTSADRFGQSLVVGAFRDPNLGRRAGANSGKRDETGYDWNTLKPINQVLVVGAPNYNSNRGAVYAFTASQFSYSRGNGRSVGGIRSAWNDVAASATLTDPVDMNLGNSVYTNRTNVSLCSDGATCLTTIRLTNPEGSAINFFGAGLGVARVPPSPDSSCNASEGTVGGWCVSNRFFYFNRSDMIDALLVGAPGSSATTVQQQAAYVFSDLVTGGIGSASQRLLGTRVQVGSRYGASLTGGFFDGRDRRYAIVVGSPDLDDPVSQTGNAQVFFRNADSSLAQTPVDLGANIPRADGLSKPFNMSNLTTLGFHNAKPVGDLNCDGYSDAVFPVQYEYAAGGLKAAHLLILYGSPSGLITANIPVTPISPRKSGDSRAPHWLDISRYSAGDDQAGMLFSGVGNINGDKLSGRDCDDLMIGYGNFYIFYGSSSGLIIQAPLDAGSSSDNTPQRVKMGTPTNTLVDVDELKSAAINSGTGVVYAAGGSESGDGMLQSHIDLVANSSLGDTDPFITGTLRETTSLPATQSRLTSFARPVAGTSDSNELLTAYPRKEPICHGDFNGDGHNDVVIGHSNYSSIGGKSLNNGVWSIGWYNNYRINGFFSVFYGSQFGLQSGTDSPPDRTYTSACVGSACPAARLFHPAQFWDQHGIGTLSADETDAFYPYRPWREHYIRRSINLAASNTLPGNQHGGVILDRFGESCISVGDVTGDGYDDLVVPLPFASSLGKGSTFVLFKGSPAGLVQKKPSAGGSGVSSEPAQVIRLVVDNAGANTNALPADSQLGLSGAGVGDLNGDQVADFVLSARGPGTGSAGSFIVVFGSENWDSLLLNDTDTDSGGSPDYEIRKKLKVRTFSPTSPHNCLEFGTSSCPVALRMTAPSGSSPRFAEYVRPAGDVNSDGFADILVSDPEYNFPGVNKTGRAYVFFGGPLGPQYKAPPSEKARCTGIGSARSCTPLALIPVYAYESVPGLVNNEFLEGQTWRPISEIIFNPKATREAGMPQWNFTNFGSRAGLNTTDVKSSDFLMCVFKNFAHNTVSSYKDLGACGLYY